MWWTPQHPYTSSLTGETSQQIGDAYETATGKQWTQPIMHYAVFEVVADAIKRTENIDDKETDHRRGRGHRHRDHQRSRVAGTAARTTPSRTSASRRSSAASGCPGEKYPYDLKIVSNTIAPDVPTNGELKLWSTE